MDVVDVVDGWLKSEIRDGGDCECADKMSKRAKDETEVICEPDLSRSSSDRLSSCSTQSGRRTWCDIFIIYFVISLFKIIATKKALTKL